MYITNLGWEYWTGVFLSEQSDSYCIEIASFVTFTWLFKNWNINSKTSVSRYVTNVLNFDQLISFFSYKFKWKKNIVTIPFHVEANINRHIQQESYLKMIVGKWNEKSAVFIYCVNNIMKQGSNGFALKVVNALVNSCYSHKVSAREI